jgi:hypothetical protein
MPLMFIVQPASLQTSVLAFVAAMQLTLSSTIAPADGRVLDANVPAEARSTGRSSPSAEVDVADLAEQPHALVLHADAAEVAGVVVR